MGNSELHSWERRLRNYQDLNFARLRSLDSGLQGQRDWHSCVQEDILATAGGQAGLGEAGGG
jgi:hypothetical protein